MSGYVVSECTVGEKDLQENIFDEKWREATNFSDFSNAALLPSKIDDMEKWMSTFKTQLLNIYDNNILGDLVRVRDKRCRDLNYYINYMLYYIPKITKETENSSEIIDSFQRFVKEKFRAWELFSTEEKFKCERVKNEYNFKMDLIKKLDDYCENKKVFKNKLKPYEYVTCCKYATYVLDKKRSFHNLISSHYLSKQEDGFHINDECTLKKFGETFPNVICKENDMSEIEIDELPTSYRHGHLPETYPEDSMNSSPTKIAVTSVTTLLGACLSGLYLYRHSFKGSRLRNSQEGNIFSHDGIYDDATEKFSESPLHYLDIPQQNNQFYIAYDPMNN
ncbi:PIR protein [Plasmodium ovale]|uniref:PIR protein n=1 Tax=Plasmodium ovale TaxID=36330 RepID=A0A1C3KHF8_PLAOA|nr:PIR protein [Plasmodium ovale]